ncbi:MAG: SUMF1/EgtB/PvdO family nonheme iron enzyme [Magnetococcales bacterium]|nr:SUMF1/EgtB/PvdO family nonheme iron enzyme [Magnetococcales bacterium]MBF0155701.1 SUMF1/EgtB/PvdO family nonheme iron enzyme [Magnetococcales bacterium]
MIGYGQRRMDGRVGVGRSRGECGRIGRRRLLAAIWALAALLMGEEAGAFLVNEWDPLPIAGAPEAEVTEAKSGSPWLETRSGIAFAWLEGGCYRMGTRPGGEGMDADEEPLHEVCLSGFWLGRQEVTQGQWRRIMRDNPAANREGDDYPVERVSREEIEAFLLRVNAPYAGKISIRLPTEAQWEFACRDRGEARTYPHGGAPSQIAWHDENSGGRSQKVGTRRPGRLGLWDMSGNVWEWVADGYRAEAYASHAKQDPEVPAGGGQGVIRGGGFRSPSKELRCLNRGFAATSEKRPDLGLRLAVVVAPPPVKKIRPKLTELPF